MPDTKNFQKGLSLYLGIVVLSIILSIVFGLTAILLNQIKMMREMGYSVTAFFAAETGVEKILKIIIRDEATPSSSYSETLTLNGGGTVSYDATVVCCKSGNEGCEWGPPGDGCPVGLDEEDNCYATKYCVRSVGTFRGIKRAVESKVYPTESGFSL